LVTKLVANGQIYILILLYYYYFYLQGGIIAKGLFIDPSFDTSLVELIITLATPHRPLFLADHYMDSYYDKVDKIWGNKLDKPRSSFLSNISLLSIGGGHRDLMVWPCLTYTPHADINVLVSTVFYINNLTRFEKIIEFNIQFISRV